MSPSESVHIRQALPHESRSAVEVIIKARRAAIPHIPPSVHTDGEMRAWFETSVMPTQDVWLAEADSAIVGVMVLGTAPDTTAPEQPGRGADNRDRYWVEQLYIAPGMTGLGIGSKLLERAKAEAGDSLDLWTFESNVGARRFYERAGFVMVDATDGDNEERAPDRRYRWQRS